MTIDYYCHYWSVANLKFEKFQKLKFIKIQFLKKKAINIKKKEEENKGTISSVSKFRSFWFEFSWIKFQPSLVKYLIRIF